LKINNPKKSGDLSETQKQRILIYPILDEISVDLVKDQEYYLKLLVSYKLADYGFSSLEPKCSGNIQGTFFN